MLTAASICENANKCKVCKAPLHSFYPKSYVVKLAPRATVPGTLPWCGGKNKMRTCYLATVKSNLIGLDAQRVWGRWSLAVDQVENMGAM